MRDGVQSCAVLTRRVLSTLRLSRRGPLDSIHVRVRRTVSAVSEFVRRVVDGRVDRIIGGRQGDPAAT